MTRGLAVAALAACLVVRPALATPFSEDAVRARVETVEEAADRVLHTKAFRFCRDNGRPVPPGQRGWCDVADQATTCPELKEMCARPPEPAGFFAGSDEGDDACKKQKKPDAELGEGNDGGAFGRWNLSVPGLQYFAWIVVGMVLAILAFVIVRAVLDRQKELPSEEAPPEPEPTGALHVEAPGLGEVQLLLRRALELADRDVGLALACLYAAVLKHLEERALIRWDSSTTNRDYVRSVRGKTPLDRPMAELVREVERTKFGRVAPARSTFDALYQRLAPQLARLAAVLVLVLALGVSSCSGCGGDPDLDGHAAFTEILRAQGIKVSRFAMPINQLTGNDAPVMVDSADFALDERVLGALEKAMLSGARILVLLGRDQEPLAAWPGLKVGDGPGGVLVPTPSFVSSSGFPAGLAGFLQGKLRLTVPLSERDAPQVLVERAGEPFVVRWRSERGTLVVVADRRLVANGAMAVPADARLAVALALEVAGEAKALQYATLGPSTPAENPAQSLEKAGLWAFVVQALVTLGVLFAARGLAFGTLRDRTTTRRRAFSEHIVALGIQLARRSGSRLATSLYVAWALERLRQRAGRDVGRRDLRALAADLAPRLGENEDDLRRVFEHADAMRRDPGGISVPERDFAVMRRLGQMISRLQAAGRRAA